MKSGDSWLRASARQSCDMSACLEARYSVPRGELVHSGYDVKRPPLCPRTGLIRRVVKGLYEVPKPLLMSPKPSPTLKELMAS
jgi:hypothetical protein